MTTSSANVRITRICDRGHALIAAVDFQVGDVILSEKPIALVSRDEADRDICMQLEEQGEFAAPMWAVYLSCRDLDPDALDKVVKLHAPADGDTAERWRQILYPREVNIRAVLDDYDRELFLRISLAFNFNSVACTLPSNDGIDSAKDLGDAIYELTSRINHSCYPNASCCTVDSNGTNVVRAIREIKAGEEILANYMEPSFLLAPAAMRRERLHESYEFVCQCARCAAYGDDMLTFPCSQDHCKGFFCLQPGSGSSVIGAHARACCECKYILPKDEVQLLAEQDFDFAAQVFGVDPSECDGDLQRQILDWKFVHPRHYLTYHLARLQGSVFQQLGDLPSQCAAARREEGCWRALGLPQREWAFSLEKLGDLLALLAKEEEFPSEGNLLESAASFQQALRMLASLDGPRSPYVDLVTKKLVNVQRSLQKIARVENISPIPAACGLCGLEAKQDGKLMKCSKCKRVAYCCHEHQKTHWPVHKLACIRDELQTHDKS